MAVDFCDTKLGEEVETVTWSGKPYSGGETQSKYTHTEGHHRDQTVQYSRFVYVRVLRANCFLLISDITSTL